MKRCPACKRSLPLDAFHKNRARHDGQDVRCKECSKAHTNARRRANPEAARAKAAVYRAATIDHQRAYQREHAKRRRQTEHHRAYQRRYKAGWLKGEKGRRYNQAKRRRRRSGEFDARGHHTREQLAGRIALYRGRCWICGVPATAVDHVKPLTKGGSEWPANLRPICKPCNSTKNDTRPYPQRPRF